MHLQFAYDLLFVHSWLFGLFGNSWAFCKHISKTVFVTVEMTSATSSHNNINSLITAPLTKDTEGLKIILSLLSWWQMHFKPKPPSLSHLLFLPSFHFGDVCAARLRAVSLISPETLMTQRAKRRPAGSARLYTLIHEHISLTCSLIWALKEHIYKHMLRGLGVSARLQQNTVSSIRA